MKTETAQNKSVVIVNCPIVEYGECVVSASSTDSQEGLFFSLYVFNTTSVKEPLKLLTKIPISKKFLCVDWTTLGQDTEEHYLGFVIGGHEDGSVSLWDMTQIFTNPNEANNNQDYGCISQQQLFSDSVNVISCNIKPNLFAVGTTQINIISIDKNNYQFSVAMSCNAPEKGGLFTSLNWNDKVNHIIASATNTGNVYIYDMKRKALFLEIMEPQEEVKSDIINTQVTWFYDGAQIIISYDNQEYNYLTQYHMKQPNAPSAMYQNGHSTSILSLAKNPFDKHFLLSLGRDNVVTCWSLKNKKPVCKVEIKQQSSQVIWSMKMKDCFIYAGVDGKLYSDRINFTEDMSVYIEGQEMFPNWLLPNKCISFGFGGKFFKFVKDNNKENNIQVYKLNGNVELVKKIKEFLEKSDKNDLNEVLDSLYEKCKNQNKANLSLFWIALKSIYNKNYDIIFNEMGFNRNDFTNEINTALGHAKKKENVHQLFIPQTEESEEDLGKLFDKPIETQSVRKLSGSKLENETPNTITEESTKNINWNVGNEKIIKKSLLLGDLESAVELLFKNNRNCEALLIASIKPELFEKAKEKYFTKENDLFVKSIFPAIINNNFDLLFDYNVIKEWKEYLFYANTYSQNEQEFENFADKLGDKLSNNPDIYSSLVCYILAKQPEKIINILYNTYNKEIDKVEDKKLLLHNLFEQILLVNRIVNIHRNPNEIFNKILYDYSLLLIQEGLNVEASKFLIEIKDIGDEHILDLYERLYFNCENELGNVLERPNPKMNVLILRHTNQNINQNKLRNQNLNRNIPNNLNQEQQNKNNYNKPPLRNTPNQPFNRPNPNMNNNINKEISHPQNRPPMPKTNLMGNNNIVRPPQPKRPFNQNIPLPQNMNANPMSPVTDNNDNNNANSGPQFNFSGGNTKITRPPAFKPAMPNRMQNNNISTPPHPNMNNNIQQPRMPPKINNNQRNDLNNNPTPFGNKVPEKVQEPVQEMSQPMNQEEEIVYNYFSNSVDTYNSVYKDENKRRDYGGKVSVLLKKLENHEIKSSLLKSLHEFMNLKAKNDTNGLRRLWMRIQSIDWDRNKSWMPLLEKLINMRV